MKITTIICFSAMSIFYLNAQDIPREALHSGTNFNTTRIRHTVGQPIATASTNSFLYGYQAPILMQTMRDTTPEILVYPNPVTSVLHISTTTLEYHYRLSTIVGQMVKEGNLNNTDSTLNLEELPRGVFVFTLFNASSEVVKELKLLKR